MKRRTVLAQVGALGTVGLAGCVSDGDDGSAPGTDSDTETETETRTGTQTATDSETATPMPPTLDGTTIEVQANDCGQQVNDASLLFDGEQVVVDGTIWAPDPSHTATLVDASYDAEADELSLTVGIEESDDGGPVVQCIAEIEYRVTATLTDGLPGTVTVTHETTEGTETVATVQRD